MANIPTFTLNNGRQMPSIGMGCWMGIPGGAERVYNMVSKSIVVGYRHFDTAAGYQNESQVGKAIRDSGIPREEFFITTKLGNGSHSQVEQAFEASLTELNVDYVDLYLMHWPQATRTVGVWGDDSLREDESPTYIETWKSMEKLLQTGPDFLAFYSSQHRHEIDHSIGKVKSIGVSNFSIKTLTRLLPECTILPAVNQIELHPYYPQNALKAFCDERGIHITAYSPLGQPSTEDSPVPSLVKDSTVTTISKKHDATNGQVLLTWGVLRGTSVIPKSENEDRMRQNITLLKLDDEDMNALNEVHTKPGLHRTLLSHYHKNGTMFGWTWEQLGWNLNQDGTWKA
ncbi:NADP-dependent oxidoreductase domain-containing protein [Amylostereum chailletii]|nr:NADP-dependent oxidoreductase domain-containing protein [Amylostereum chailletii]